MNTTARRYLLPRAIVYAVAAVASFAGSASAQVIASVTATNLTSNSAVITWSTDKPSTSLVNYGITTSYGATSAQNSTLITAHSVRLSGLAANTLYNFDVVSGTGVNNTSTSANFRFATINVAPAIANINVINLTSTSLTVNWTTDQPATAMVNYGLTSNYGFASPLNSTLTIAHSITLTGLAPNTTYDFNVVSAGLANTPSASANQTFTTPAASAQVPNVGFVASYGFTNSSAVLSWSTDLPANTVLAYGTTTALGQFSPVQSALTASHGLVLTGLNRGTTYYYVAESTGASGATGYSYMSNFTTSGPVSLVPVISNVASSNLTAISATISWTTDAPSTSQVNYGTTTAYGSSSALNPNLTTAHSITLTGLTPGTPYDFQVVSASPTGESFFGANMAGLTVWAWGDSLTLGYGDLSQNTYPLYLSTDIGMPVNNEGIGGYTSTQIAQVMFSMPAAFTAGNCSIIWSGGNNPNAVSTVLSDIASMVNLLNSPKCFLVMGDLNAETSPAGTAAYEAVISTNVSLAAQYPNNYLNIRELLVNDYNPALALDQQTHAGDVPAASLHAVRPQGTITSGALDNVSCAISVSNGTNGVGTVLIIDSETILINAIPDNIDVTACTRGYNGTAAASHLANASYSLLDPVHLGSNGYEFIAQQVDAWFATQFPLTFSTPAASTLGQTISAVTASSITGTTALITWTTDQPSTSLVNYGVTSGYGTATTLNTALTTTHSVALAGLTANSVYNFDVVSANSAGKSVTSANSTFTSASVAAPAISSVVAANLTATSATITWTTSQPATAQVKFGPTAVYGTQTSANTTLNTNQAVMLTGLSSSTTYNYEVISANASGASAVSANYMFTTPALVTATPPNVGTVAFSGITNSSVVISWSTDVPANTELGYGPTTALGQLTPLQTALTASHSVTLTGLSAATTYFFVAQSTGANGATGYSTVYSFSTIGTPGSSAPVTSALTTTAITATSATITWTTDKASNSEVNYGATSAYGSSTGPDSNYVTSHSVTLTGLSAGTTYNYDVVSATAANLSSTSGNSTFTTTAVNATSPYVGYVAAWGINNSGATVTWSTDVLANTQLAYGTTTALGQLSPVQAALANSHGVTLTGLTSGTTYYFVAESTGSNGATGYSTTYSFTTSGTAPTNPAPVISAIATSNITNTSLTITWTTDQASTSQVNYGTTTTYTASSPLNSTAVTSHSVMLSGLTLGTTYNFAVVSTNSFGTSTMSPNASFTTTGSAPAPVISAVIAGNVTSGTATITWTTDQASSSQANYGLTTGYGASSTLASALVTSHSVMLTGLTPNTKYNFDVISVSSAGKSTTSANYTFSTQALSATPPNLSNLAFWGVTSSSVVMSWSTDVASNTAVAYGPTTALGKLSPVQTALTMSHGLTLTGLAAGTTYYFVAQSADANGNTGYSITYTFTTVAGPPTLSAIVATPGTGHLATVSWTTSAPTYSYVQYGTASGSYGYYSTRTSLTATPQCNLTYVPSGTIFFQVVSLDANGNQIVSPEAKFTEP